MRTEELPLFRNRMSGGRVLAGKPTPRQLPFLRCARFSWKLKIIFGYGAAGKQYRNVPRHPSADIQMVWADGLAGGLAPETD